MQTNYRNTLLDPHWVVAITEEIAANPMGIAFSVEPEILARYDCQQGFPCDPLGRGYRRLGDIESYIATYNDTAAQWAATVQEINNSLLAPEVDYQAELDDLVEGLLDEEWIRRGC